MSTPSHSLKGEQESSGETGQGKPSKTEGWQLQRQRRRSGTCWGASGALVSMEVTCEERQPGKPGEMEHAR